MLEDELTKIYHNYEWWHKKKLEPDVARKYFKKLIQQGNIIYYEFNNEILGYVEFWRIDFKQLGRIICHAPFCADGEDITSGDICYLANTWIHPDFRNGYVYKVLKKEYFKRNGHCKFHIGETERKKIRVHGGNDGKR